MSLLSALNSSAEAMRAFQRGLETSQNNVSNVSTPGFAKQQQTFFAKRFEPDIGIFGGVQAGPSVSTRNRFAEEAVWQQQHGIGQQTQLRSSLEGIEPVFSVQEESGISWSLDQLFQSFSQLTVSPNDATARQTAIERAGSVARDFNQAASSLDTARQNTERQLSGVVDQINEIGARIASINGQRRGNIGDGIEAGSDAAMHQALEELAQLVDFSTIQDQDGTISVYLGGQTLFVIGDRQYDIGANITGTSADIVDSAGQTITGQLKSGQLSALVEFRNTTLPTLVTDLNTLAQTTADLINTTLAAGLDQNGLTPTVTLFTYNSAADAAATLSVNNLQPADLALALPAAPNGNGNAIALAGLANQTAIGGETLTGYYSSLASRVGRNLTDARQGEQTYGQLLSQAKAMRTELSGVSLDEEAALMMQYQRSYQAAAEMFRIVNEMTESLLSIAR